MTPKEKALELVNKFGSVGLQLRNEGIACALIAVDEIINAIPSTPKEINALSAVFYILVPTVNYWQEVKQEIENL